MRRGCGARDGNHSRVPQALADAVKAAYVGVRMLNAGGRPLPDFLIIGAQRCGTTSLYRYLAQHPQVIGAAPSKGVHYFDMHHERSLRWYRAHFPTGRRRDRVVRAFSQYQQEYARGFEDAETFEEALELEVGRLDGERERMLADPGY